MSNLDEKKSSIAPRANITGVGLVVLDIILNNGSKTPIFNAGGTCGNVLAGLSFLDWQSKSISRAGKDVAADIMIKDLLADGVNVDYITREEKLNTPRIIEQVNSNGFYAQHHFFLRCPTCDSYLPRFRSPTLDFVSDIIKKDDSPDVFFFDRLTPSALKLAKESKKRGALVFFEPNKLKNLEKLEEAIGLCHILKFSNHTSAKNVPHLINDTTILKKIRDYRPYLIIKTLGEHGLFYSHLDGEKWQHKKAKKPKKVYDTCGAGDWLTVGFLFYLQKQAFKNRIKLIDALQSTELVTSALDFSQMIASLSGMFVGAMGLSKQLKKNEVISIIEENIKKNSETIPLVELVPDSKTSIGDMICKEIPGKNYCPTCLLNK
jgi:sugar/nucleoside kinase (ribokinase family)